MSDSYERERQRRADEEKAQTARIVKKIKFGATLGGLALVLLVGSCQVISHATTIPAGEVGIVYKKIGSEAGIQPQPLGPGWHWRPLWTDIIAYPTRERVYAFTKAANKDAEENEEVLFADSHGLVMTGDVQVTMRVLADKAPALYAKYKLPFEEKGGQSLLYGPIHNDLKSFIAKEAEQVPVTCAMVQGNLTDQGSTNSGLSQAACTGQIMGSGREAILQRAFDKMKAKWATEGVDISSMNWIGQIRYPNEITNMIIQAQQTAQAVQVAQQQEAQAHAQAQVTIEKARGVAEATKLRGEALRSNPEIIQQIWAEKSKGICPPTARTCIVGSGASPLISDDSKD